MGANKIQERLDAEIKAMEAQVQWSNQGPEKPAEPFADGQPAQGAQPVPESQPSSATEPVDQYGQSENTFNANPQPFQGQQEEPASQKRTNWKSRFTKLKQYHDAEIYKLRTLTGQLHDKVTQLETDNISLADRIQSMLAEKPRSIKDLATQEEIDRVGEEELTTIERLTKRTIDDQTADLRARVEKAEKAEREARLKQAEDMKAQAYDIFLKKLGALVPDYAEVNLDPRLEQWLQQLDPASGFKRMDLFKQAEASGDVGRVAGFFNEFKSTMSTPHQTLDSKVTPVGNSATVNNGNHGQPPQGEMIPMAEYMQFMDDSTRGRFRGTKAEELALQQRFDRAIAEGRLV